MENLRVWLPKESTAWLVNLICSNITTKTVLAQNLKKRIVNLNCC